jgi:hypothetical protein
VRVFIVLESPQHTALVLTCRCLHASVVDVTLRAPRVSSPADPVRVVQLWAAETFITFDTSIDLKVRERSLLARPSADA